MVTLYIISQKCVQRVVFYKVYTFLFDLDVKMNLYKLKYNSPDKLWPRIVETSLVIPETKHVIRLTDTTSPTCVHVVHLCKECID